MQLTSRSVGSVHLLELSGRFDSYVAASVVEWLEGVSDKTPAQVIVNLAGVNFVDSTALATLVQGLKRCRDHQGDLLLCGLQRQVYMIFELTRLDKAFNIFVDEAHAMQAFPN